jgi:hypothetical protein
LRSQDEDLQKVCGANRNRGVIDFLMKEINDGLTRTGVSPGRLDLDLLVVIDEVGRYPTFLRVLCAVTRDLIKDLERDTFRTVRFIACGTGAEVISSSPGSDHQTYHRIFIGDASVDFFQKLVPMVYSSSTIERDVAKIVAYPTLKALTTNRRSAYYLIKAFKDLPSELTNVPELSIGVVRYLSFTTAVEYRKVNGLAGFKIRSLSAIYATVLNAIMLHGRDTAAEKRASKLLRYGVLTDHAYIVPVDDTSDYNDVFNEERGAQGEVVRKAIHRNRSGRYSITPAQLQMLQSVYGTVDPPRSGTDFEDVTVFYFDALMYAVRKDDNPTLSLLVRALTKGRSQVGLESLATWDVAVKPLEFESIRTVRLRNKLEVRMTKGAGAESVSIHNSPELQVNAEALLELGNAFSTEEAVIVVNAREAMGADVYVVIPGVVVFFVQAKNVEKPLSPLQWKAELFKMGFDGTDFHAAAMANAYGLSALRNAASEASSEGKQTKFDVAKRVLLTGRDHCGELRSNSAWYGGHMVREELLRRANASLAVPVVVTRRSDSYPSEGVECNVDVVHVVSGVDFENFQPMVRIDDRPKDGFVKKTEICTMSAEDC